MLDVLSSSQAVPPQPRVGTHVSWCRGGSNNGTCATFSFCLLPPAIPPVLLPWCNGYHARRPPLQPGPPVHNIIVSTLSPAWFNPITPTSHHISFPPYDSLFRPHVPGHHAPAAAARGSPTPPGPRGTPCAAPRAAATAGSAQQEMEGGVGVLKGDGELDAFARGAVQANGSAKGLGTGV